MCLTKSGAHPLFQPCSCKYFEYYIGNPVLVNSDGARGIFRV